MNYSRLFEDMVSFQADGSDDENAPTEDSVQKNLQECKNVLRGVYESIAICKAYTSFSKEEPADAD